MHKKTVFPPNSYISNLYNRINGHIESVVKEDRLHFKTLLYCISYINK